ncbi:peroxiredoxin Q/BCP [Breoghania corrubedonensis]|uniref:thioredoxin-dependent peroxiredoxin n=1 Tax=Breoghania corrubedonensis TaxID=665038 RepID=A0A2T5V8J6_9HYPH|nr:thioredoxin-dependent thiol peroxidase [Breoghania corrubedonensis]PTW60089.1 peroxiredoxin Q/BCP [Breoghania corrubedonensis]
MSELLEGATAPDFTLPTDSGETVHLSGLKGRKVVVYFYPKADTPGCTTEALDFTARKAEFEAAGAIVIALSPDACAKHAKFRAKHDLDVVLASDEGHAVADLYGVWVEKKNYGRTYMGIERSTFLIDRDGRIAKIWRKVKVKDHAEAVLAEARALS